jgi:hypothetical protein
MDKSVCWTFQTGLTQSHQMNALFTFIAPWLLYHNRISCCCWQVGW